MGHIGVGRCRSTPGTWLGSDTLAYGGGEGREISDEWVAMVSAPTPAQPENGLINWFSSDGGLAGFPRADQAPFTPADSPRSTSCRLPKPSQFARRRPGPRRAPDIPPYGTRTCCSLPPALVRSGCPPITNPTETQVLRPRPAPTVVLWVTGCAPPLTDIDFRCPGQSVAIRVTVRAS